VILKSEEKKRDFSILTRKNAKTQKRKNAETQKRKNAKTQKRKNAKTQKRKNAKTQKRTKISRSELQFSLHGACTTHCLDYFWSTIMR
jgi:hypothetical protein